MNTITGGKFYYEMDCDATTLGGPLAIAIGIIHNAVDVSTMSFLGSEVGTWGYHGHSGGEIWRNGPGIPTDTGNYITGDVIMVAIDMDNGGSVWWGKNGVWANGGDPATNTNPIVTGLNAGDYYCAASAYNLWDAISIRFVE